MYLYLHVSLQAHLMMCVCSARALMISHVTHGTHAMCMCAVHSCHVHVYSAITPRPTLACFDWSTLTIVIHVCSAGSPLPYPDEVDKRPGFRVGHKMAAIGTTVHII
jgi:hypothetical protein